jgi:hypothetical protein
MVEKFEWSGLMEWGQNYNNANATLCRCGPHSPDLSEKHKNKKIFRGKVATSRLFLSPEKSVPDSCKNLLSLAPERRFYGHSPTTK